MDYMARALALAKQALARCSPNPAVGAVVVSDGAIVGEGFTQPPGEPHAEAVALKSAEEKARGATLYVTLEPCCHFGRTPPCTRAIIAAGIAEVHMAMQDPNPLVAGRGRAELEQAGIKTATGEMERQARDLNEAYVKYITTGLPLVIAKFAMSLDGKIATRTGDSRWVSGEGARQYVHQVRRQVDAIAVGVNTVLRDDPQLTSRDASGALQGRQPLRVIVDSHARTSPTASVFQSKARTLLAVAGYIDPQKEMSFRETGAEVVVLPMEDGWVDLRALLRYLGRREVTSLLVEGGSTLLGSFFDRGLVDKVLAFVSPVIIGGKDAPTPVGGEGANEIEESLRLHNISVECLGDDTLIIGYTR